MKKAPSFAFVLCVLGIALLQVAAYGGGSSNQFRQVVVFGDSLSDTGNLFAATTPPPPTLPAPFPPDPPYFMGRFSNGPVWVERMAAQLRLPIPAPSELDGTNYAWGGAETGDGISARGTPNVGLQIQTFLAENRPESHQLFVVFAGANDFNNAEVLPDPVEIASNVVDHVRTLADAGAEYFLVPNLPPLGQTPRVVGTTDEPLLDLLSIEFNIRLARGLWALERELDITIIRPRMFALFEFMINVPVLFGFENVTGTAKLNPTDFFDTGVVDNPDAYLFFDDVHPTRVTHEIMGSVAAFKVRLLNRRAR